VLVAGTVAWGTLETSGVTAGLPPDVQAAAMVASRERTTSRRAVFLGPFMSIAITVNQRIPRLPCYFNALIVTAWMRSAGHRDNLLSPDLQETGVGCYTRSDQGLRYWCVQAFGAVEGQGQGSRVRGHG